MLLICHPSCTTCQKARDFLKAHRLAFTERDIRMDKPSQEELRQWLALSGLPLKRFFNTSGILYREMALSARLPDLKEEEQLALLATDGMLVRRPILVDGQTVLVGFNEKTWSGALL